MLLNISVYIQSMFSVKVSLNNNILVLCKRRAQLKQVVQLVVEVAMSYIPELENDTEGLVVLLETLRQVRVHIGCLEGETLTLYK